MSVVARAGHALPLAPPHAPPPQPSPPRRRRVVLLPRLHSSWNIKSATAQLVAIVARRVFRARRTRGESESANRVSHVAVAIEFPLLFATLKQLLQDPATGDRCRFAVGAAGVAEA